MLRKILIVILFLATSTYSYGEWSYISSTSNSDYYIDKERIKRTSDYVYYWEMGDFTKEPIYQWNSIATYNQVDCIVFRYKVLQINWYEKRLAVGNFDTVTPDSVWEYPYPGGLEEIIINEVCKD